MVGHGVLLVEWPGSVLEWCTAKEYGRWYGRITLALMAWRHPPHSTSPHPTVLVNVVAPPTPPPSRNPSLPHPLPRPPLHALAPDRLTGAQLRLAGDRYVFLEYGPMELDLNLRVRVKQVRTVGVEGGTCCGSTLVHTGHFRRLLCS